MSDEWMRVIAHQARLAGAVTQGESMAAFRSGHIGLALAIEHPEYAIAHWQSLPEPVRREASEAAQLLTRIQPLTFEVPA